MKKHHGMRGALVLLLALVVLTFPVLAADALELKAEAVTASAAAGTSVEVPIRATANPGYSLASVKVTWDKNTLILTDVTYSALAPKNSSATINNGGQYLIDFGDELATTNFTGTGVFITLKFTVAENALPGKYEIGLKAGNGVNDADLNEVALNLTNGSVTLNAPASSYVITYSANGGSGAPAAQTKTQSTALTLSSTKPSRAGYTFLGWAESSTATTAQYQPGGSFTKDANTTLYAVWQLRETEFTGSERVTSGAGDAYSVAIYCAPGENLIAYGARYSADGQFLGLTSIALTPGQENELVIPIGDGSFLKVFVVNGSYAPVCSPLNIPVS